MSAPENKPEIAGMLCAPPEAPVADAAEVPQPRQPTSLQGLLKFAMDATKAEDAPHEPHVQPMDEARRKFLEQALHSLTIDVIEILLKQIKILENVDALEEGGDDCQYRVALDTISDHVCDVDTANDFHKIGGFVIVGPCLRCKSPKVRAEVCNLLAELCQNNPYCQRVVLENGIMPVLVDLVENDGEVAVVVKALYAMRRKLILKFASCCKLCAARNRILRVVEPRGSDEHVLGLLLKLIEDNPSAIYECRQNKLNAKEILENYLSTIKGKEEYSNEEESCNSIYNILFAQN
ncbi:hypothetical protein Zmor_024987 [Zophobas morio]|uniref:Nucleotide exchange factor Fes1 domain-containing protein n=1 Tax=Zophobas morio TaxID=2755281 RepID=A0AA38HVV1_9CUCU|nr:hypothetical protein Zmor_024987 [Zophobas morio]